MKNPPHPGIFIRDEVLEPFGLSITRAADVLGVRRATLSDLIHGKASLTADMAFRIEKAFAVSMDLLLRIQIGYDIAQMRQRGTQIKVGRFRAKTKAASST